MQKQPPGLTVINNAAAGALIFNPVPPTE